MFDFNVHLPSSRSNHEFELEVYDISEVIKIVNSKTRSVENLNLMLFSDNIINSRSGLRILFDNIEKKNISLSILANFRDPDAFYKIKYARDIGAKGIKFHSYHQKIRSQDFSCVLDVARYAENLGMFVCIDTSYGTSGMYLFDNMKLACFLSDNLSCPIILLHSGGLRIMEAMLLAEEKKNVFLETSFTLPYYKGSSIEFDIIFAYRKLGASRIIYGSDFPYIDVDYSFSVACEYLDKCGFSDLEREDILTNNALNITNRIFNV